MEVTPNNNPMSGNNQQMPAYGQRLSYQTNLFDRDVQEAIVRDRFEGTNTAYDMQYKRLNEQPQQQNEVQQGASNQQPVQGATPTGFANKSEYDEYLGLKNRMKALELEEALEKVFGTNTNQPAVQVQQPTQAQNNTAQSAGNSMDDLFGDMFPTNTNTQDQKTQVQNQGMNSNVNQQQPVNNAERDLFKAALTVGVDPVGFGNFVSEIQLSDLAELYKAISSQQPQQQQNTQQAQQGVQQQNMNYSQQPVNLAEMPAAGTVQTRPSFYRGNSLTGTLFE